MLKSAGLFRRLAALIYDSFLITALCILISAVYTLLFQLLTGRLPAHALILQLTLFPCLLLSVFYFYYWFWTRYGRTLGMQTWRIKLVSMDGKPLTLKQCTIRFLGGWISFLSLGLGFLWVMLNQEKLAWHDRWSRSQIIREA